MLQRVLEPEVMDTAEEARDYDAMDHADVNAAFCEDLLAFAAAGGHKPLAARKPSRVIDFGTGTALIPVALCGRAAGFPIVAIDLSAHMLSVAKRNVARARLDDRVLLERVDAKRTPYEDGAFGATISNSIVHHIPDPARCFAEMWRVTAKGGLLFVRDLVRPSSEAEVDALTARYGGAAPAEASALASFEAMRASLRASLCAALTVPELVAMLEPLGVPASAVTVTSDRHWTLAYEKP